MITLTRFSEQIKRVTELPAAANARMFGLAIELNDGTSTSLFVARRELQSDWIRRLNDAVTSRDRDEQAHEERPAVPDADEDSVSAST
jgi:hypothetical protein